MRAATDAGRIARAGRLHARLFAALLAGLAVAPTRASDRAAAGRVSEQAIAAAAAPLGSPDGAPVRPTMRGPVDPAVRVKMNVAFPKAARMVRAAPECRALFSRLGADGATLLARTYYVPVTPALQQRLCGKGASAITHLDIPVVMLCREFGGLGPSEAAITLVHEALHAAGLPERPSTSGAMSSAEINQMVRVSCQEK